MANELIIKNGLTVEQGTTRITGSALITGSLGITGSLQVTNGITGSLFGTSSWAVSASWAPFQVSSSYSDNSTSASYALTASYALNAGTTVDTGSFVTTSSFNSYTGSSASQFAGTSSYALTASYVENSTGTIPHITATAATLDTYTATVSNRTSYQDGDAYLVRFITGNTTGCTLNINGLGAISLYRNNDGPLLGGDILDGAEMLCVYNSTTNGFQCIGISPNSLFAYVKNDEAITITKGQPVYAYSGQGDRMTVKLAYNTGDSTSAQTVGLVLSPSIAAGQKGVIMMQGLLDGVNTLPTTTWSDGDPVYLGATAGSITKIKPHAPNHLVYLGVVTTASPGSAGRMYVRVQNGYELDELHNVLDTTTNSSYGDLLVRSGSLWINSNQLTGSYGLTGSLQVSDGISGSFSGSGANIYDIPASAIIGLNLSQIVSGSASASISPDKGLEVNANVTATSFTGSLFGTSSWAVSSSQAISSSFAISSSRAVTSSYALTASVAPNYVLTSTTSSMTVLSSSFAISSSRAVSASYALSSSYALTASVAPNYVLTSTTSSMTVLSSSFALTASYVNPLTQNVVITGSLLIGSGSSTIGLNSNAQGYRTIASGAYSHAEGLDTIASGPYSNTQGYRTTASADYSHAEGQDTQATGDRSHAEGSNTQAIGDSSHAEGIGTQAIGAYSHAEGNYTIASGSYQHVQGQFNKASSVAGAFIHGNGTSDASRSNLIFASGSEVQITGSLKVQGATTSTQGFIKPGAGSQYLLADGTTSAGTGGSVFPYIGNAVITGSTTSTQGFIKPGAGSQYLLADGTTSTGTSGNVFPYTGSAVITGSLRVIGSSTVGSASVASGLYSHAQGNQIQATGQYSHAQGVGFYVNTSNAIPIDNNLTLLYFANYGFEPGYGTAPISITPSSIVVVGDLTSTITTPYTLDFLWLGSLSINYMEVNFEYYERPIITSVSYDKCK